jgi:hypothetical protein
MNNRWDPNHRHSQEDPCGSVGADTCSSGELLIERFSRCKTVKVFWVIISQIAEKEDAYKINGKKAHGFWHDAKIDEDEGSRPRGRANRV